MVRFSNHVCTTLVCVPLREPQGDNGVALGVTEGEIKPFDREGIQCREERYSNKCSPNNEY